MAAVEFAMVVPVFFILVLGMIELGRMVMVDQILTSAAREGGRRAVMVGSTQTDASNTVTNYLTNAGITGESVTVSPDPASAAAGDAITVTVTVPTSKVSWLPVTQYTTGKNLTASAVMRKESSSP